jgi:hypothetical protein
MISNDWDRWAPGALAPDLDEAADNKRHYLAAVLLYLAGWLFYAWPWVTGSVIVPWDGAAHFVPQVQFLARSIHAGEWPFWTPNVFSGHPQIADPQSQIFSPPMLLLALFDSAPGPWSVDVAVLLCVAASGLGMLWLFREHGWSTAGGLVAALAFSLGSAMAWRLQHFGQVISLAYLPFAILFLRRALARRSATWGLLAGLVAGGIALGRDQVALLELYLLVLLVVMQMLGGGDQVDKIRGAIMPLAAGAAGGAVVALIPILLTLLLAAQSNRPIIDFAGAGAGSLHPALLITFLTPHLFGAAGEMAEYWGPPSYTWRGTGLFIAQNVGQLYIGAVPLLLVIVAAVRGWLGASEIRYYLIAFILVTLYALGWYTPAFYVMYELMPGVDLYRRPADAVFLMGAFGAILAGYGAHRAIGTEHMDRSTPKLRWMAAGAIAALFAFALFFAIVFDRIAQASIPLLAAAGWVAMAAIAIPSVDWLQPIRPLAALAILGGVTAVDLAINNGPNGASGLPPAIADMLDPATKNDTVALLRRKLAETASDTRRDRVELAGLGFHWPNASLTHNFEHTLGYNPVRLKIYAEATGAEDTVGLPDQRKYVPLFPSYRSPLANLLGLRFIATGIPVEAIDKALKPGDLRMLARTADGWVYENPRAFPRVLFARRAQTGDFDAMLADGKWPDVDLNETVLLERTAPPIPRGPGRVRIVSYGNNEVALEADSPDGGWVVLNDVWQPWWSVEVDGETRPVLRANVLFRAVEVSPGRHSIRFVFQPLAGAIGQLLDGPR